MGQRQTPNVVLIVADDMGWGDLGCYGATAIPTPAMDRIAREGVRATDCHAASALCTPSRYALLTGRYAWRSPLKSDVLFGHSPPLIEEDRVTLPRLFQDAGYATGAFGKWHLGLGWHFADGRHWSAFDPGAPLRAEVEDGSNVDYAAGFSDGPTTRGFDRFFGIAGSLDMAPYCYLDQDRLAGADTLRPKTRFSPQQRPGLQAADFLEEDVDARFVAEACAWIRTQAGAQRPFFCYLPLSAPHRPCLPPAGAAGRSQAGPRGDMVAVVDDAVASVLALLDELGLAEETLLVATSDNGARLADVDGDTHGHRANGHFRGQKADIYEGGHREPFVARWPGCIPAGSVTGELLGLVDLPATLAAAAGITLPAGAAGDSVDQLALLTAAGPSGRASLVQHSGRGVFSLRRGPHKLVLGKGSGGFSEPVGRPCDARQHVGQLYDVAVDPGETTDCWDERPEVVRALYGELKEIAGGPASGLSFDIDLA
jgi:arylsulfatase A-like enzyme